MSARPSSWLTGLLLSVCNFQRKIKRKKQSSGWVCSRFEVAFLVMCQEVCLFFVSVRRPSAGRPFSLVSGQTWRPSRQRDSRVREKKKKGRVCVASLQTVLARARSLSVCPSCLYNDCLGYILAKLYCHNKQDLLLRPLNIFEHKDKTAARLCPSTACNFHHGWLFIEHLWHSGLILLLWNSDYL